MCLAGYANEVGEAFRNMVAVRFVHVSYAISCGYVLSHAVAQGVTSRNELDRRKDTTHTNLNHSSAHHNFATLSKTNNYVQKQSNLSHGHNSSLSLSPRAAVLDTLLWQGLASVVIPGLIINWLCAASRFLLNRHATRVLSQQFRRWASTGVGLASIPVIIHLIDW